MEIRCPECGAEIEGVGYRILFPECGECGESFHIFRCID